MTVHQQRLSIVKSCSLPLLSDCVAVEEHLVRDKLTRSARDSQVLLMIPVVLQWDFLLK